MTNTIRKARFFVQKLCRAGVLVEKAYLFGSHAKREAKKDSDIDICIVSNKFGKDYIKEMVQLRKVSLQVDSRIEPIPFGVNDLADPYSTLASEIRKTGIQI